MTKRVALYLSVSTATVPRAGASRNAFKKVLGLRARRAPIFWVLGPDGTSEVFLVAYRPDGVIEFIPTVESGLTFRPASC